MSNFKAGDKVVCVDDSPAKCPTIKGHACPCARGGVYCVRDTLTDANGTEGIWLVGIFIKGAFSDDVPIISSRFRLVSEVKLILSAVHKNAIGKEVETHTVAQP
jgi:hypothetical protein